MAGAQPAGRSTRLLYGENVAANGIRQHYLRFGGAGHSLVLVPGITSPAATWAFVAERLAEVFDVYVLDVRGRGLSSGGSELRYDLDTYADDVHALVHALGLESYHLLGHSMGARIGARVSTRCGDRLARLVMVDPPVTRPGSRPYDAPLSSYLDAMKLAREGHGLETFRPATPAWRDEQIRARAEWLHTCDDTAVIRSYEGFYTEDIHGDLARMSTPALLVVGETGVINAGEQAEITSLAPQIPIVIVAGAGHMIPFEQFEGFFAAIGSFLGPDLAASSA